MIHTAYEAWGKRDIHALLGVVHPDAEARPILGANIGTSVYHGRQGLRDWFRDLHQEWETFESRVVRIEARGEMYHLVEIRDGMILRLEAFRDRDDAFAGLEAT